MIKVSVIIPLYKAEKYIEKCIRSLFEQTLEDLEYIFINDHSPDKSIEILERTLEEYPDRKNQVKIINHQENRGVSQSRQDGLDEARGEYVIHCDADDWVDPEMYRLMYDKAKECDADIVGCDILFETIYYAKVRKQDFTLKKDEIIKEIFKGGKINSYLWNRLVRTSFIKENYLEFDNKANLWEDMLFLTKLHQLTDKVEYIPMPLYHYRILENSITHQKGDIDYVNKVLYVTDKLQEEYSDKEIIKEIEKKRKKYLLLFIQDSDNYNPDLWLSNLQSRFNENIKDNKLTLNKKETISVFLINKRLKLINRIFINILNIPEQIKLTAKKILYPHKRF